MDAFSKVDVDKGNFYSLMFFVVALGNVVVYAIGGWVANLIGQVSLEMNGKGRHKLTSDSSMS